MHHLLDVCEVQPPLFDGMTGLSIDNSKPSLCSTSGKGSRKPSMRQVLFKPRRTRLTSAEIQFCLDFFLPPEWVHETSEEVLTIPPVLRQNWRPPANAVERQLELLLPSEEEIPVDAFETDDHRALSGNVFAIHDKLIEISLHALADDRCSDDLRYEILNWVAHPGYDDGVLIPFSFEACCACTGTQPDEMRDRLKVMFATEIRRLAVLH